MNRSQKVINEENHLKKFEEERLRQEAVAAIDEREELEMKEKFRNDRRAG